MQKKSEMAATTSLETKPTPTFGVRGKEEESKPNPAVQRLKIIMAVGLIATQLYSRFLSQKSDSQPGVSEDDIWWRTLSNISVFQVCRNATELHSRFTGCQSCGASLHCA